VLLTPTLNKTALPLGALLPQDGEAPISMLMKSADWVPFCPVYNVTGQPAISLPLAQSSEGLPVGLQFAGRAGAEETLLSLAGQLEQARPWTDRRPALAAAG
jgi:amidase